MDCPVCKSSTCKVRESRRCKNDTQRRRYECLACGHRWTAWDGVRPVRRPPKSTGRRGRLTHDEVRQILLAPRRVRHSDLGRAVGVTGELIRQIRVGLVYASIHPEIARWGQPLPEAMGNSCYRCYHWRGDACGFGFPDPELEGPTFARDCDLYEVSQSMSLACPAWVQ